MAKKNVKIDTTTYSNIESVSVKNAETANLIDKFYETSDANAIAGEIAEGKIGYVDGEKVEGTYVKPSGSITANTNGTYDVTNKAEIVVAVEGGYTPVYQEKTASVSTEDDVVVADEGYDALAKVTVPGAENLVAGNIKNDVEIFGVTGTFVGSGKTGNFYFKVPVAETSNYSWELFGEEAPKFYNASNNPTYIVTLSSNCSKISSGAFNKAGLANLISGNNFSALTTIGSQAFKGCSRLTSFEFPNLSLLETNEGVCNTFENCTGLKTVNFPKLTELPTSVFKGCTSLETVQIGSEGYGVTSLSGDAFSGTTSSYILTIYTTGEYVDTFASAIRENSTTCQITFKASEETEYGGNIKSAGETLLVVEPVA